MATWEHGRGSSAGGSVRAEGADCPAQETLQRYRPRPSSALERFREIQADHLVYVSVKPGPGGSVR